jgi:hypothetical protein
MAGSSNEDGKASSEKKATVKKFTRKTKEFKFLVKLFKDGKISPTDKPADVRSNHPGFQAFTVTQFRSQFNRVKGEFGTCTKEGVFTHGIIENVFCLLSTVLSICPMS